MALINQKDKMFYDISNKLKGRGVSLESIAYIVYNVQKDRIKNIDFDKSYHAVESVIAKREVQHLILSGLNLDILAEKHLLDPTLNNIIYNDEPLFGVDEDIASNICHLFGSIAETNYGNLDVNKTGIIKDIDQDSKQVNTFLDDIVGAIAASAMARLAHNLDKDYGNRVVID